MRSIRKFFAITLLALLVCMGTETTFASDGSAESPGITNTETSTGTGVMIDGSAESPGYTGVAESPGFIETLITYLDVII